MTLKLTRLQKIILLLLHACDKKPIPSRLHLKVMIYLLEKYPELMDQLQN